MKGPSASVRTRKSDVRVGVPGFIFSNRDARLCSCNRLSFPEDCNSNHRHFNHHSMSLESHRAGGRARGLHRPDGFVLPTPRLDFIVREVIPLTPFLRAFACSDKCTIEVALDLLGSTNCGALLEMGPLPRPKALVLPEWVGWMSRS